MDSQETPNRIFFILLIIAACHMLYYYPKLPNIIPSQYGIDGQANQYMSKQAFITIYAIAFYLVAAIFYFLVKFIDKMPVPMTNMPKKEYWLAPERRDATYAMLRVYLLWMGNSTLMFLILVMHTVITGSIRGSASLGKLFFLALTGFMLFTLGWSFMLYRQLSNPPQHGQ